MTTIFSMYSIVSWTKGVYYLFCSSLGFSIVCDWLGRVEDGKPGRMVRWSVVPHDICRWCDKVWMFSFKRWRFEIWFAGSNRDHGELSEVEDLDWKVLALWFIARERASTQALNLNLYQILKWHKQCLSVGFMTM